MAQQQKEPVWVIKFSEHRIFQTWRDHEKTQSESSNSVLKEEESLWNSGAQVQHQRVLWEEERMTTRATHKAHEKDMEKLL